MTGRRDDARAAAAREIGGDRKAIRAEQLRALGTPYRCIARELRVDREAVTRWFAVQDALAEEDEAVIGRG